MTNRKLLSLFILVVVLLAAAVWPRATFTPAGGGLSLREVRTASASASLDFTSCLTAAANSYRFDIEDLVPSSSGVDLLLTASTDGGSTYLASTNSRWAVAAIASDSGAVDGASRSNGTSSISLAKAFGLSMFVTGTGRTLNGHFFLSGVNGSGYKSVRGEMDTTYTSDAVVGWRVVGRVHTTSAVNAVKFAPSSSTIASGTIRCYSLAK